MGSNSGYGLRGGAGRLRGSQWVTADGRGTSRDFEDWQTYELPGV